LQPVWYRPVADSDLDDMLTDSDGVHYDVGIPPPKVRDDLIDRLREDARDFLPATLSSMVHGFVPPITSTRLFVPEKTPSR
jgi:hypothetical protein